jgi:hypothetical protein
MARIIAVWVWLDTSWIGAAIGGISLFGTLVAGLYICQGAGLK